MSASLYALMRSRFPADRSRPVLTTPEGRVLSYGALDETTARYARFLSDRGVVPGDRVAVQVDKSPEALMLYLACVRAGFVYMPMNTAYQPDEVDYLLGNAEPAVFVSPDAAGAERAARHGVAHHFTLDAAGSGSFTALAASAPAEFGIAEVDADDLAAMLYTSGTTGKPKGAMLTHRNLASNGLALVEAWRFTAEDVLLHALPIFHVHGLFIACHCVLLAGARMIWLSGFDRERVMAELPHATVLMGVPTFYTRLLADPAFGRAQSAHVRLFVSGSAPLLAETHEAFTARTGHAILERYGMTETGMIAGNPYEGPRVPGAVGLPFAGVALRVVDDTGAPAPDGTVGDVQVRGPNVMTGYWRMPEKTREDFTADGWFKTGDVGVIDDLGYLRLVGRAKDLIISGGYNVYPKEIEEVIDALPGIVESAVVGVPHPDFGEVGVAVVVAKGTPPDEAALLAHLKQHLANYKVPKAVYVVDDLPRNTMGKVQKKLLRERYADCFLASAT